MQKSGNFVQFEASSRHSPLQNLEFHEEFLKGSMVNAEQVKTLQRTKVATQNLISEETDLNINFILNDIKNRKKAIQ